MAPERRPYTVSEAVVSQRRNAAEKKSRMSKVPEMFLRLNLCTDERARLQHAIDVVGQVIDLSDLVKMQPFCEQYTVLKKSHDTRTITELRAKVHQLESENKALAQQLEKCHANKSMPDIDSDGSSGVFSLYSDSSLSML
jgi:hypothetical protein